MQHPNTLIDDVCAVVGFSATVRLIEWFGGRHLYVPCDPSPSHPIAKLIGASALRALSHEFGGQPIWIPTNALHKHQKATALKKRVAKALFTGGTTTEIAKALGISVRQVQRIRRQLVSAGIVPGSMFGTSD